MLWAYNPSAGADIGGGAWGFLACKDSLGGELPVQGDSVSQNLRGRVIVEDIRCQHRPPHMPASSCARTHMHTHERLFMYSWLEPFDSFCLFLFVYFLSVRQ